MVRLNERSGALIGAIILLIPAWFFALWIYACNQTSGYPGNVNLYRHYLPPFLRGRFTTTILSFILCVAAVGLNVKNVNSSNNFLKAVSWVVVVTGGLLGLLNLFSMM